MQFTLQEATEYIEAWGHLITRQSDGTFKANWASGQIEMLTGYQIIYIAKTIWLNEQGE